MADPNVLQDFFIGLGFKTDEVSMRKMTDNIEKVAKRIVAVAAVAEATSLAVSAALARMAKSFEDAYFAASRTGSSVQELKAFQFAASQLGSTAEEALSAVEGLSQKMRENPGMKGYLKSLGVTDVDDATKATEQLLGVLSKMPIQLAEGYAKQFGLPEKLLLAGRENLAKLEAYQQEYRAKASAMGVDLEKAARDGKGLSSLFRSLDQTGKLLYDTIGSQLFEKLGPTIERLTKYIDEHGQEIAAVVVEIAEALLKMFEYLVTHLPDIEAFIKSIGGWKVALTGLALVLASVTFGLGGMLGKLTSLAAFTMPSWLMGMLGVGGAAAGALGGLAAGSMNYGASGNEIGGGERGRAAVGNLPMEDGPGKTMLDKVKRRFSFARRAVRRSLGLPANDAPRGPVHDSGGTGGTGGSRSWRNNNPGNIEFGPYAMAHGATRSDGRFAIFPDYATGRNAQENLLFDSKYYKNLTLAGAINKWAPGSENNVPAYIKAMGGDPNTRMSDFAPDQRSKLLDAMQRHEGWREGKRDTPPERDVAHTGAPIPMPAIRPFGNYRPELYGPQVTPPLGARPSAPNDNSITMTPTTNITVSGVSDPQAAAGQVSAAMKRQHSTLLRNLQSAVG